MPVYPTFYESTSQLLSRVEVLGTIDLATFGDWLKKYIADAVFEAFDLDASGEEKKAHVVARVAQMYDALTAKLPWFWRWLAKFFRGPALAMLDGVIESTYRELNEWRAA